MSTIHLTKKFRVILFSILFFGFSFQFRAFASNESNTNENNSAKNDSETEISYSIEPFYDVNSFRLIVQMEFTGGQSGATKLILPDVFGGQNNLGSIKELSAESPNTIIENTGPNNIKIVKYIPFTRVKITYRVEEIRKGSLSPTNNYQAVINRNYFHFLGETFFIIPNWDAKREINFRLEWKHFPSAWNFANSFGINQKVQETKSSLTDWIKSVFTGGDFRIVKRAVNGSLLFISVRGEWKFSDAELGDLSAGILKAERDFWNEGENPFYLITILPLENGSFQSAIGRVNALSMFLPRDGMLGYDFKRLLAHELFHRWIGDRMNFTEPPELLYWFREGFAEYYARLLLLRAKQISISEYEDSYNTVLNEYFTSSARYEKNESLVDDLPDDPELFQIPRLRGDIIAHNLNLVIRKTSNWTKSLDDLMRDLYLRCTKENLIVSNGSLSAMIRYYAGEQTLIDIMRVLNSGAVLKTFSSALGPCFRMQIDSHRQFWLVGEKYDVPKYEIIPEMKNSEKKCLEWFGVN